MNERDAAILRSWRIPTDRESTPPGEILFEEFLAPMGMSAGDLARKIGADAAVVESFVDGRSSLTPTLALRLAAGLGTQPRFWTNLQAAYDLSRAAHVLVEIGGLPKRIPGTGGDRS